jgi:hypothetical protein
MSTGVHIFHWSEGAARRDSIMGAVRHAQAQTPNSGLDVGTGWSSPKTLFAAPALAPLVAFIRECLGVIGASFHQPWTLDGWANIMVSADTIKAHDHVKSHHGGKNTWAGAYYPSVPRRAPPLYLELAAGQVVPIVPRETTLIIFPAAMRHEVPGAIFDGERVSISFNAKAAAL